MLPIESTPIKSTPSICFVVNPKSAGGRTETHWTRLLTYLVDKLGSFDVRYTTRIGEGEDLTRSALRDGYEMIIAVGGDGTNNEVVNGFFEKDGSHINPDAVFGFYPSGSGGDLRRSLRAPANQEELLNLIKSGASCKLDVGLSTYTNAQKESVRRYFINIASFGLSSLVVDNANRSQKPLGGTIAFAWASLKAMYAYRNIKVELTFDDQEKHVLPIYMVAIANGCYFGGGMKIAPNAKMDDGLFDIVVLGDISKAEALIHSPKIYGGSHLSMDKVDVFQARKVRVDGADEVLIELDGELPGGLPATFEILPKHLNCRVLSLPNS